MAKRLVEQADVFAVANEIKLRGESPTAIKILDELGQGSLTTITKFLKQWQVEGDNCDAQELPPEIAVPGEVTELAGKWIKTLWTAARKEAEMSFNDRRTEVEAESEKLAQQLKESEAFSEAQDAKLSEAFAQIEQLKATEEKLVNEVAGGLAANLELERANNELSGAIAVLQAEKTMFVSQISELKHNNAELTDFFADLRNKFTKLTNDNVKLAESKAGLQELSKTQLESLGAQVAKLEKALDLSNSKNEKLQNELVEIAKKSAEKGKGQLPKANQKKE